MRVSVRPGSSVSGIAGVPGDKSIAHRLLILAATARGSSRIGGLPASLDVLATASVLSALASPARPGLERWLTQARPRSQPPRSSSDRSAPELQLEGDGRGSLTAPDGLLDCANSGTTMRLTLGVLAGSPFRALLTGDESLRLRPMERVGPPLRARGATRST